MCVGWGGGETSSDVFLLCGGVRGWVSMLWHVLAWLGGAPQPSAHGTPPACVAVADGTTHTRAGVQALFRPPRSPLPYHTSPPAHHLNHPSPHLPSHPSSPPQVPILSPLSERQLWQLARAMRPAAFKQGEVVFRKGEPGDAFYVVHSGAFTVFDGGCCAALVR